MADTEDEILGAETWIRRTRRRWLASRWDGVVVVGELVLAAVSAAAAAASIQSATNRRVRNWMIVDCELFLRGCGDFMKRTPLHAGMLAALCMH